MEILCSLRLVDLVKDKPIRVVFSRSDVKGFYPRLGPNQRQVFAQCLNEFRATLWLNLCFDQHDYFFVSHIRLLLQLSLGGLFSVWSAATTCHTPALAINNTAAVAIDIVPICSSFH